MTLYVAWAKTLFAIALGVFCCGCFIDPEGLVASLMSLPVLEVLANLTFGTYMLHYVLIIVVAFQSNQLLHYDVVTVGRWFLALWVGSHALAFAAHVVVELPIANL